MWYYLRYWYNLLLIILQVVGLTLFGLGTGMLAVTVIAILYDLARGLLGYDLLLTENTLSWAGAIVITACGLGASLSIMSLGATDPEYLRKLRREGRFS